ncbi:MAG: dihydroxy-acid dehydratase [Balneolaceae bacterium]|nr:dihydroxy-acid dehydratase [Balneolaceae bacterium]
MGQGACGGMYTANTMASAIETLGNEPAVQLLDPCNQSKET